MEIRLKDLVKKFSEATAVDGINVTFEDGKLTGLLGPSGCGKSTTLYMISGLEDVTSGQIFFGDRDVTAVPPEERNIGLVFQNYALYPHMTVFDNIAFPLTNMNNPETGRKYTKSEIEVEVSKVAHLVQIEEYMKRKPGQLSGGQQQRVAIARALVKKPSVLLLDEPLSNLDARLRMEMRQEIRRIQQDTGVTTIFVTHDQEEAMSITDSIVLMKKGVVQQMAPAEEMYMNPCNRFVASFLGNPPISFLEVECRGGKVYCLDGTELPLTTGHEGKADLGIRPEAWHRGSGVKVTVTGVESRGQDQVILFDVAGQAIKALADAGEKIAQGDTLEYALRADRCYFFDPEDGKRL